MLNDVDLIDESAAEGTRRLVSHLRLERDRRLVEIKKRHAAGSLKCEVCGFDFEEKYGRVGRGFCEVHHRKPLGQSGESRTRLQDLAIVCSNCHRMLHRGDGSMSIQKLRGQIRVEAS